MWFSILEVEKNFFFCRSAPNRILCSWILIWLVKPLTKNQYFESYHHFSIFFNCVFWLKNRPRYRKKMWFSILEVEKNFFFCRSAPNRILCSWIFRKNTNHLERGSITWVISLFRVFSVFPKSRPRQLQKNVIFDFGGRKKLVFLSIRA